MTPREKYRAKMASEIWICVFLVGLGALIMIAEDSRYLEPFGLLPIVMAVALAGVSRPWRSVRTDLVVEEDEDVSDRH